MDNLIIERNIERYADRLRTEIDPAVRASVKALLIEEENRLGFRVEQLDKVNGYITDSHHRIEMQQRLIERLRSVECDGIASLSGGRDLTLALRLLVNLRELLILFEQYRQRITDALAKYPPHGDAMLQNGVAANARGLTPREIEVLALAAQGNTSDQIADILRLTRRTVDAHVQAILPKLEAANSAHAVAIALTAGIIKFN